MRIEFTVRNSSITIAVKSNEKKLHPAQNAALLTGRYTILDHYACGVRGANPNAAMPRPKIAMLAGADTEVIRTLMFQSP